MDIGLDRASEVIKAIGPKNIIVGGYGVITPENWEPLIEKFPWITIFPGRETMPGFYKIGEAEEILRLALDDLQTKGKMESVYVRNNPFNLQDSRDEPYLNPEVWNRAKYLYGKGRKVKAIEASRGCDQGCDFCPTAKQTITFKPLETLVHEIELLDLGFLDILFFVDQNMMNLPPDYLRELFTYINTKGYRWVGEGTITALIQHGNQFDDVIRIMGKNCLTFLVGVEDLDHATRGSDLKTRLAKASNFDDLVKKTRELGLPILYSLVFGTDFQEPGYGEATATRVLELGITAVGHLATPRPGTPFWEKVRKEQRLHPESGQSGHRNMRFYIVHEPMKMSGDQTLKEFMLFQKMIHNPVRVAQHLRKNLPIGKNYAIGLFAAEILCSTSRWIFEQLHPEVSRWADEQIGKLKIHR